MPGKVVGQRKHQHRMISAGRSGTATDCDRCGIIRGQSERHASLVETNHRKISEGAVTLPIKFSSHNGKETE
jgi:hypothetical protein